MATIRATNVTIELSRDGEHWTSFPGGTLASFPVGTLGGMALSCSPWAAELAASQERAEVERIREQILETMQRQHLISRHYQETIMRRKIRRYQRQFLLSS
jgi:hypothetical protein